MAAQPAPAPKRRGNEDDDEEDAYMMSLDMMMDEGDLQEEDGPNAKRVRTLDEVAEEGVAGDPTLVIGACSHRAQLFRARFLLTPPSNANGAAQPAVGQSRRRHAPTGCACPCRRLTRRPTRCVRTRPPIVCTAGSAADATFVGCPTSRLNERPTRLPADGGGPLHWPDRLWRIAGGHSAPRDAPVRRDLGTTMWDDCSEYGTS